MANAHKWRTAYKRYQCDQSVYADGCHYIHPGDRYALVTVFPIELFDSIAKFCYCSTCAVSYMNLRPDPLEKR